MADKTPCICSARTSAAWSEPGTDAFNYATNEIRQIALSENVSLLAGLGTSLGLKGRRVSAPGMQDLWKEIRDQAGVDKFTETLNAVGFDPRQSGENIEALLSRCNLAFRFTQTQATAEFVESAEKTIRELIDFVDETTDLSAHETILRKLARRPDRLPRLKIFTTNYDLCFETAARKLRFIAVDGFSLGNPRVFDASNFDLDFVRRQPDRESSAFLPNVFHLHKLHGSIDWERQGEETHQRASSKQPLIIYPRDSKFESSYEQPYLEMMSRFQTAIRAQNTGVLLCGVGFNDRHISQPIMQAISANIGLRVVVVDPTVRTSANECFVRFRKLVETGDARITLVHGTFAELAKLLPDLSTRTESEGHDERIGGHSGAH